MSSPPVLIQTNAPYVNFERAFSNQQQRRRSDPPQPNDSPTPDDNRPVSTPSTSSSRLSNPETCDEEHHESPRSDDIESCKPNLLSRISKRRVVGIAKVVAMVALAIALAGILIVPVAIFANRFKSSPSLDISTIGTQSTGTTTNTETQCIGEIYSGSMCQTVLLERQSCIPGRESSSEVVVAASQSQQVELEQQLGLLFSIVPEMSEQCGDELLAFLCVEAFMGLCDPTGTIQRTSTQDCERITTITCSAEFQTIEPILRAGGIQMSCNSLPQESTVCSSNNTGTELGSGDTSNATVLNMQRNCSDGFIIDENGLCAPECGVWWPRTPSEFRILTIPNNTFAAIGLAIVLIVIFISCLQYKKVFRFPAIFTLYQMLSLLPLLGVVLMSYIDIQRLMCNSKNLIQNLLPGNESIFCSIEGASLLYFTSQVALWWLFHLSMIFISVFWPFKYQFWKNSGHLKYIHITLVIVGLVLPIIPVIICSSIDGFALNIFYPPQCNARSQQAVFYSFFLPMMCAVAVGIFFLVLITWKLVSEEMKIRHDPTKRQVEIKLLILLISYVIVWPVFIGVSVFILIESPDYINTLVEYFLCEAPGTKDCSAEVFQQFSVVPGLILNVASLYPATFLIYFINIGTLKKFINRQNTTNSSTATSSSLSS